MNGTSIHVFHLPNADLFLRHFAAVAIPAKWTARQPERVAFLQAGEIRNVYHIGERALLASVEELLSSPWQAICQLYQALGLPDDGKLWILPAGQRIELNQPIRNDLMDDEGHARTLPFGLLRIANMEMLARVTSLKELVALDLLEEPPVQEPVVSYVDRLKATHQPLRDDEEDRLAALLKLDILDTPYEALFDDLVQVASLLCNTPIALITLVDANRQWFKSKLGMEDGETPREISFCQHALLKPELMEVQDATQDDRFRENPLVTGTPDIRFYAGAPLVTQDGFPVGTLCVIDRFPRALTVTQRQGLERLARIASGLMQAKRLRQEYNSLMQKQAENAEQ